MGEGHMHRQRPQMNYIEVMSLRAWSSSSLMALYLSFWEYNSSIGIRDGVFDGGEIEEGGEEEVEGRNKNRCRSEASNPAARRAPVNRVTDSESMTWRQRERERERERVEGKQKIKLRRNGKELKQGKNHDKSIRVTVKHQTGLLTGHLLNEMLNELSLFTHVVQNL